MNTLMQLRSAHPTTSITVAVTVTVAVCINNKTGTAQKWSDSHRFMYVCLPRETHDSIWHVLGIRTDTCRLKHLFQTRQTRKVPLQLPKF
jgi:hypothetical protein